MRALAPNCDGRATIIEPEQSPTGAVRDRDVALSSRGLAQIGAG